VQPVRETSGLTMRAILCHARERGGGDAVARLLALAGGDPDPATYEDPRRWWSYELKIRFLEAAADVLGDERIGFRIAEAALASSVGSAQRLALSMAGGPTQLIRLVARASVKFTTVAQMRALKVRRGNALVSYRLADGYRPHRHDCDYTHGLLMIAPALFGLAPATVRHDECQILGAPECRYEVRWHQPRLLGRWRPWAGRRAATEHPTGVLMSAQLRELQQTVAALVAARAPEQALAIVAERAGYAVHAQAFLLVARPGPDEPAQVHGFNFSDADLARYAENIADPTRPDPFTEGPGDDRLVAAIASPEREYGHLVAYGDQFLPTDGDLLASYANLTAVTLDGLAALATAAARRRTAEGLLALARSLAAARTVDEVARVTVAATATLMGADRTSVLLADPDGRLRVAAHHGWADEHLDTLAAFAVGVEDTPALGRMLADPHAPQVHDRGTSDPFLRHALETFDLERIAVVGIARPDRVYGILVASFGGPRGPAAVREFVAHAGGLADQAATAVHSCELLERTMRLAHVDALTGVANRRAFLSALSTAIAAGPGALLFLDLNGFKQINDRYGHAAGDEVLAVTAGRLLAAVRADDTVARLAGDEFVVLVPACTTGEALADLRDRVAAAFAAPVSVDGHQLAVRASVGATLFRAGESSEAVLHRADQEMYRRKRSAHGAAAR
jgi:diguanylate cyclase (GGDEF)-like protein